MDIQPNTKQRKKYIYGAEQQCIVCLSKFTRRDKSALQKCCSYKCRGVLQTKKLSCAVCLVEFKPSRLEYKTCSRSCGTVFRLSNKTYDPMVKVKGKLATFCCGVIAQCFRNKTDRTSALLGYTVAQLKNHLESHFEIGMSWENYGKERTSWSIDHTRPISSFPVTAPLSEINSLENLRPMWHTKNCSKRNKWEGL